MSITKPARCAVFCYGKDIVEVDAAESSIAKVGGRGRRVDKEEAEEDLLFVTAQVVLAGQRSHSQAK